jgi:hypothetical protein
MDESVEWTRYGWLRNLFNTAFCCVSPKTGSTHTVRIHTYIHTNSYIHTYTHTYTHTRIHIYTHPHTHTHTHTYIADVIETFRPQTIPLCYQECFRFTQPAGLSPAWLFSLPPRRKGPRFKGGKIRNDSVHRHLDDNSVLPSAPQSIRIIVIFLSSFVLSRGPGRPSTLRVDSSERGVLKMERGNSVLLAPP